MIKKFNELSKEKLKKLASLKSEDEINTFLAAEDVELDEEALKSITGGIFWRNDVHRADKPDVKKKKTGESDFWS